MQQIQLNGSDLMYLKNMKLSKKHLPELLVRQAKASLDARHKQKAATSRIGMGSDLMDVWEETIKRN